MTRAFVVTFALLACIFFSRDTRADDPPKEPYSQPWYARSVAGFGGLPNASSPSVVLTAEIGHRPFYGALETGGSFSSASDWNGAWTVLAFGGFAKLDLTYLFLSGFWARKPSPSTPVRVQLGSRVGIAVSDSFGLQPPYTLVRAEMEPFIDVEIPLDVHHSYAFVVRGALDTSVSLNALFRWSVAIGFSYGWGHV